MANCSEAKASLSRADHEHSESNRTKGRNAFLWDIRAFLLPKPRRPTDNPIRRGVTLNGLMDCKQFIHKS